MSGRSLQADNARLRREVAQLKKELADERKKNKPVQQEYNVTPVTTDKPNYDARNPIAPGKDPVWEAWQQKRRSWING